MKTISTTIARKNIGKIVEAVKMTGRSIAIGRHNRPEVVVVRFHTYNDTLSDVTNMNALGGAFDLLWDEPDIYSQRDIKWHYAKPQKQKARKR